MSTIKTTTRLSRLHAVMVPTTDLDRAIAFYEGLGFAKTLDVPFEDGHRWVELNPPDGTAGIALAPGTPESVGVRTGIILLADDIDAAHAELRDAGLDVDAAVAREGSDAAVELGSLTVVAPTPAMFAVRDPDGNALLIVGD
jgi:catechol 2,3-dioxygenase-like lactoylglutathione lyase family enzyme